MIEHEGVKLISLGGSLYEASERRIEKSVKGALLSFVVKGLESFFGDDEELKSIQNNENVNVKLILSFDTRRKGGAIGRERLGKTAIRLIEDDERSGFKIETLKGNSMTPDELRVFKKIKLTPRGKSVDRGDVWREIKDYYLELKGSGMLEQ